MRSPAATRQVILEILKGFKRELPGYFDMAEWEIFPNHIAHFPRTHFDRLFLYGFASQLSPGTDFALLIAWWRFEKKKQWGQVPNLSHALG